MPDAAPAEVRPRRWPRRLAIAAGVVVALVVLLRVLLPTAIERGAAWAGPRYLGLPIRIANVDLGLLRGRVAIEGLAIGNRADAVLPPFVPPAPRAEPGDAGAEEPPHAAAEAAAASAAGPEEPAVEVVEPTGEAPDDVPVLLRWDRVFVELDWSALFSRTVHLRALEIDAPHARVERRPDGTIDPLVHARPTVPPGEPEPAPAAPEPPGEPWAIAIDALALRDPDVRLVDETSGDVLVAFALEQLGLDRIAVRGGDVDLGGVGIARQVLRVRREDRKSVV